jgi:HPt (histidine-containing phosphotransfer) domain-containing protein
MAETLDRGVLADLCQAVGDDPAFIDDLVDTYLADAPGHLAAIDGAVEAADAAALVVPAHTLKGNSTTIGAAALAELARTLEEGGRRGELDGATGVAASARAEFDRVVAALEAGRTARWAR